MGPVHVDEPRVPGNGIVIIQDIHIPIGEIGRCKGPGHKVTLVHIHGCIVG